MSTITQTRPTAMRALRPPLTRLVSVELRKSFDTTAGLWLLASIAGLSVLTTGAVIAWSSPQEQTYETFTLAIGRPLSIVLPVIATLSLTSEWSQRTGLTTFSLVPDRRRVVLAKALAMALVAAPSVLLAFGVGALGHLIGTAIRGTDPQWNLTWASVGQFALGNVLGVLVGFILGLLLRSTAGALAAYFVITFVAPPLAMLLAAKQAWFDDLRPWADLTVAQNALFGRTGLSADQWQQLAVTSIIWLVVPLALGVARLVRAEVK
jgi:ABC-type transport system involved in multi-copper enzyme maturation permease subunit